MAGLDEYRAELEAALSAQQEDLQTTVVPRLKEHFRRIRSSYEAMYNVVSRKGLVKDDPYNYEERISDLDVPDDLPMLESDKDEQMSVRLAKYGTRIEYLTDYYDFTLESLTLKRLRQLVKFSRFINWSGLSEASTRPTTRAFAEMVAKIKKSGDQFSSNVVSDGQEQLNKVQNALMSDLKRITSYKREEYKYAVRTEVLPAVGIPETLDRTQYEGAAQQIRKVMPKLLPGRPFARDLVVEIFAENDPETGPPARQALLDSLKVAEKPKEEKKGPDLRKPLLDGARTIAGCSRSLEETVKKLQDNLVVLDSRKISFGEMMKKIWERLRGKDEDAHTFVVEYIDETTGAKKTESIAFEPFLASVMRRVRIYNGILSKGAAGWNKIQAASEDDILSFLTKEIKQATEAVRRFESLDTYFRAEVARDQRNQLRGINAEMVTIRDSIARARKRAHEYVAKTEEIAQLKKLGIG